MSESHQNERKERPFVFEFHWVNGESYVSWFGHRVHRPVLQFVSVAVALSLVMVLGWIALVAVLAAFVAAVWAVSAAAGFLTPFVAPYVSLVLTIASAAVLLIIATHFVLVKLGRRGFYTCESDDNWFEAKFAPSINGFRRAE